MTSLLTHNSYLITHNFYMAVAKLSIVNCQLSIFLRNFAAKFGIKTYIYGKEEL